MPNLCVQLKKNSGQSVLELSTKTVQSSYIVHQSPNLAIHHVYNNRQLFARKPLVILLQSTVESTVATEVCSELSAVSTAPIISKRQSNNVLERRS